MNSIAALAVFGPNFPSTAPKLLPNPASFSFCWKSDTDPPAFAVTAVATVDLVFVSHVVVVLLVVLVDFTSGSVLEPTTPSGFKFKPDFSIRESVSVTSPSL